MSTNFSLTTSSPSVNIIQSINYLLATQGQGGSGGGNIVIGNTIVTANTVTGQIASNNAGVIGYLYPYIDIMYANTATGSSGFSTNSQNRSFYGIYNTTSTNPPASFSPTNYVWTQVSGGFGNTKALWYTTTGGGTINFSIVNGNIPPNQYYTPVIDDTPILLAALANSIVTGNTISPGSITNVQIAGATITGYNISNNTITGSLIAANTIVGNNIEAYTITGYNIAGNTITGNLIAANTIQGQNIQAGTLTANLFAAGTITAANSIQSVNATFNSPTSAGFWLNANTGDVRFAGNTSIGNNLTVGANAQIGANLNVGSNANIGVNLIVGSNANIGANLTVGNSATIGNNLIVGNYVTIGVGANIAGLITLGNLNANTVGTTQITNGAITTGKIAANTITGNLIQANTIQGNSIVAGTITATQLAAGTITAANSIQSVNATFNSTTSAGFWLNANTGDVRFAGNTSVGNNLTVGANAQIGSNLNVGVNANIGSNLFVGVNANIGSNLSVGDNATIGNYLTIGVGANIGNVILGGVLGANTVGQTQITANAITTGAIAANAITGNTIQANTISGTSFIANTFQANTINGNSIVAGSITAQQISANLILAQDVVSQNAVLGSPYSAGYWLQANTGSARFGSSLNVGDFLTVGNNAVIGQNLYISDNASIGANLYVQGLIYAGNLQSNTVTTINLVQGTVTQSITQYGFSGTNPVGFTNGNTQTLTSPGYLWPLNTRGFAIGGGTTIVPVTIGSPTGSRINVSYNASVSTDGDSAYLTVELFKSGASNTSVTSTATAYYPYYYRSIRSLLYDAYYMDVSADGDYPKIYNGDYFKAVGAGGILTGNAGVWTATPLSSNYYDTFNVLDYIPTSGGISQPPQQVYLEDYGLQYTANVANASILHTGNIANGTARSNPAINAFGSTDLYFWTQYPTPTELHSYVSIIVGAGGQILRSSKYQDVNASGNFRATVDSGYYEYSGTFADLLDISGNISPSLATPQYPTANIELIAVGTGGTIIYNSRSYISSNSSAVGSVNGFTTNWTTISNGSITSNNLNSVQCNWIPQFTTYANVGNSANGFAIPPFPGNVWIAVGDNGTILRSNGNAQSWTTVANVPTTKNLNGVAFVVNNNSYADYISGQWKLKQWPPQGYWVAVGDQGTVLYSNDNGATWSGPVPNPADGSGNFGVRNLEGVAPGWVQKTFVAVGESVVVQSVANTSPGGTWINPYQQGPTVNSALTRLQYYGSWANIADQTRPPVYQQLQNNQIVSGSYYDTNYIPGSPVTYYLAVGNMLGNSNVYVGSPTITVTEYKR